jgi:hypothetical protein
MVLSSVFEAEIGGAEAFGEAAVDRRQEPTRPFGPALGLATTAQGP